MYYKSGNVWMCIGFHIAWNLFQSVVYGMPVSGLDVPAFLVSAYPVGNLLNGGGFGIEGGVLTTVAAVSVMAFTLFYYRTSEYRFFGDHANAPQSRRRSGRTRRLPRFDRSADRFRMERDRFRYRQAPVTFLPSGMMGRMLD